MSATLYQILTSRSPDGLEYKAGDWMRRSRQVGKRHPLSPNGRCMTCGDTKFGYWQWVPYEPDDVAEREARDRSPEATA